MAERQDISSVVADCVRYWQQTGVPRAAVEDMRLELQQHLTEAAGDGRTPERVVGTDLPDFAESWALEYRKGPNSVSWSDVTSGRVENRSTQRRAAWAYVAGAAALVAGVKFGTQISGGDNNVDNDLWRWVWTILAVAAAIAEIFTAGFFLLPISIGAVAAAVLAWFGVNAIAQWLVFFGVTIIAFAYLQRFVRDQDEDQPRVGANRLTEAEGIALTDIIPDQALGMVRVGGEEWRAITDGADIVAGTKVVVEEVRGSKLVVSPMNPS